MPGPAVITIPHILPHQTSAAFLADLVNTMSNTCPKLRTLLTYLSCSHQIHSITHHIIFIKSLVAGRETLHVGSTTLASRRLCVSRLRVNLLRKQMSPSRGWVKCIQCAAFVIPVCINWPSVGHQPISSRCTNVSAPCHHTVYGVHNNERMRLSVIQICICNNSFYPHRCSFRPCPCYVSSSFDINVTEDWINCSCLK